MFLALGGFVSVLLLLSKKLVMLSIIINRRSFLVALVFAAGRSVSLPRRGVEGNQTGDHDTDKKRAGHRLKHGQHPRCIRSGSDVAVPQRRQSCKTEIDGSEPAHRGRRPRMRVESKRIGI